MMFAYIFFILSLNEFICPELIAPASRWTTDTCTSRDTCTHLEKDGLDHAAVLALLLLDHGVEDVAGGDALVRQALRAAHQPQEHVGQGVLGPKWKA